MTTDLQFPNAKTIRMTLVDVDYEHFSEQPVRVFATPLGVSFFADTYGDHTSAEGHGSPIFLELCKGHLRLFVWADINREEPTHIIDLDGAREDRRIESGE